MTIVQKKYYDVKRSKQKSKSDKQTFLRWRMMQATNPKMVDDTITTRHNYNVAGYVQRNYNSKYQGMII